MKLDISKESEKTLLEVDVNTAGRMIKAIIKIPSGDVKQVAAHEGLFRLRLANWRVLFYVEDDGTIKVKRIGPRGGVYNNL